MWIPIFPPLFYPGAHTQDLTLDLQIHRPLLSFPLVLNCDLVPFPPGHSDSSQNTSQNKTTFEKNKLVSFMPNPNENKWKIIKQMTTFDVK